MQHFQKTPDTAQAMAQFQQAMIEDAMRSFRPKAQSFDFE
jgi:hypothetical protein